MAVARGNRRGHGGCFQALLQFSQSRLGLGIRTWLRRVGIHDERKLARQVVDHGQLLGLQQQDVGHTQIIWRARSGEFLFDVAHRVVPKVARQATAKARQALEQGHLEALLVRRHKVQRVAVVGFLHHAIGHHLGLGLSAKTAGAQHGAGGQANEAKAPKALATHHRLQQKAALALLLHMGELEVQRQRGFQIRKRLRHQRNAVVALLGQLVEFVFSDHRLSLHSPAPQRWGRSFKKCLLAKLPRSATHGARRAS